MRQRMILVGMLAILPGVGCLKAPVRRPEARPPPAPKATPLSQLLGTWEFPARNGKAKRMTFEPGGRLIFEGGLEYYNPAEWTLIESRHELILTLLHAPEEKLDIFHTYVGDGVKSFDRNLKEVTYTFDADTWTLNVAGWTYSKQDKPAAPPLAEPVLK